MKISRNWLQTLIDLPETDAELEQLLTGSGLEVEEVISTGSVPGGLLGVVLGRVLAAEPFTVKDKVLHLCKVDIGAGEPSQIVCGAANVAAGQTVVVATVGSTIYPTQGQPLTIGSRRVYGQLSEGMICAEDELGLGSSHAGIMVLETALPPGTPAADYFVQQPDSQLVIGLTPNRADAASHLGVARDLKALLGREIRFPEIALLPQGGTAPLSVQVENQAACPRYVGLTLRGLAVGPSPQWLRQRLEAIGVRSINNVVDVTNFVLHELGQPLHAFDAAAIGGGSVRVKTLPAGTPFVTLDGQSRTLAADDLMICDAHDVPLCMAGVFGGLHSGVSEKTTDIFLESACFSADYVRKTAQRHGLKTDASFRFERGTDPNLPLVALQRAVGLLQEVAAARPDGPATDTRPEGVPPRRIAASYAYIHTLIGQELAAEQIKNILQSLGIEIIEESPEGFTALVPPYRVDVTRPADLVEEIIRIYGLNNIGLSETLRTDYLATFPLPAQNPDTQQNRVARWLAGAGWQEIFTNSLTKPAYAAALGRAGGSVEILNKLSEDLGVLRQTLLFSGLEALAHNINRRQRELRFFEFGKTYYKSENQYVEKQHLGLFLTGNVQAESWQQPSRAVRFADLHDTVQQVLTLMGQPGLQPADLPGQSEEFAYGLSYAAPDGTLLVRLGAVPPALGRLADLKQLAYFADFDWAALLKGYTGAVTFREIPRFPQVRRDLSLVVDKSLKFTEIEAIARSVAGELLTRTNVFDVYEGPHLGEGRKAYSVSFMLQDETQTLTDATIDATMNALIAAFEQQAGAVIRR